MSVKFCKKCGHKNVFVGAQPKFCNNCGNPFGANSQESIASYTKKPVAQVETLAEDESDSTFVPVIQRLEYDVTPHVKKTFKAEEIFGKNIDEEKGKT